MGVSLSNPNIRITGDYNRKKTISHSELLEILYITSKSRKLKKFARYKEKENYEYVNKLYATCYIWLGLVVAIFGTILNICYNLFWASPKRIFFCLLLVMVLEIFMDAFVNIRLQIDDYDFTSYLSISFPANVSAILRQA